MIVKDYSLPRNYIVVNQAWKFGENMYLMPELDKIDVIREYLSKSHIPEEQVEIKTMKLYKRFLVTGDIDYTVRRRPKTDSKTGEIVINDDGYPKFELFDVLTGGDLENQAGVKEAIKKLEDNPDYSEINIRAIEEITEAAWGVTYKMSGKPANFKIVGTLREEVVILVVKTVEALLRLVESFDVDFEGSEYHYSAEEASHPSNCVFEIHLDEIY